jgi:hypothetical protein
VLAAVRSAYEMNPAPLFAMLDPALQAAIKDQQAIGRYIEKIFTGDQLGKPADIRFVGPQPIEIFFTPEGESAHGHFTLGYHVAGGALSIDDVNYTPVNGPPLNLREGSH